MLWIPAGEPPHKSLEQVSSRGIRLEMVRAAALSDPRFEVSAIEIDRPGPSYSVDTVRALSAELPEADLFLIVGVDQFRDFGTWRAPDGITRLARLAVMDREGQSADALADTVAGGREAIFVPVRRIDISSTAVRAEVREGHEIGKWVPSGVAAIIEREGLYSGP